MRGTSISRQTMMFRLLLLLCLGHCLPAALGVDLAIYADAGDNVTLRCDGPAATDTKEVMWLLGGTPVCSYKNGNWCETHHYVNRIRLESIEQNNFSLVIYRVRKEDHGEYTCRINNTDIQSIRLNVTGGRKRRSAKTPPRGSPEVCRPYREREDPPEASSGGSLEVGLGLAVGLPVAAVIVFLVAVLVAAVLFRRYKTQHSTRRPADPIQSTALTGMNKGDGDNQRTEEPAHEGLADPTPSTADGLLSGVSGHFGGCSVNQRTTARTRLGL